MIRSLLALLALAAAGTPAPAADALTALTAYPAQPTLKGTDDAPQLAATGKLAAGIAPALTASPVPLPPLRNRLQDIPLLVHFMITRFAPRIGRKIEGVSQQTMNRLLDYGWPGNVRELENLARRLDV